jgi:hypothetical protein
MDRGSATEVMAHATLISGAIARTNTVARFETLANNFGGNPLVVPLVSSFNRPAKFYNGMITNQDVPDPQLDVVQSDWV